MPSEVVENRRQDVLCALYERTYRVLLNAGCDDAQARAIARERVEQAAGVEPYDRDDYGAGSDGW